MGDVVTIRVNVSLPNNWIGDRVVVGRGLENEQRPCAIRGRGWHDEWCVGRLNLDAGLAPEVDLVRVGGLSGKWYRYQEQRSKDHQHHPEQLPIKSLPGHNASFRFLTLRIVSERLLFVYLRDAVPTLIGEDEIELLGLVGLVNLEIAELDEPTNGAEPDWLRTRSSWIFVEDH